MSEYGDYGTFRASYFVYWQANGRNDFIDVKAPLPQEINGEIEQLKATPRDD